MDSELRKIKTVKNLPYHRSDILYVYHRHARYDTTQFVRGKKYIKTIDRMPRSYFPPLATS